MKLPLSFGSRLFLRLLVPGFVLAVGWYPCLFALTKFLGVTIGESAIFSALILAGGWLLTINDMPIYMLFEGRRYWPGWLRKYCIACQQRRVAHWLTKSTEKANAADHGAATELAARAYRYPIGGGNYPPTSGLPGAIMPTELGNVIYGFETYPTVKYGVDGVFFWERIWITLSTDVKQDLDEQQSLCDSALYASFASLVNVVLFLGYGILATIFAVAIPSNGLGFGNFAVAIFFALFSRFLYCASIYTNMQFGERIKAMFDVNVDKLCIDAAMSVITKITKKPYYSAFDPDKNMAAWRYLRWHEFRPSPSEQNVDIETYRSTD